MPRSVALALAAALLLGLGPAHAAAKRVFFRGAGGRWQPLACRYDAAAQLLRFTLDPAQTAAGETVVVIDPPPGVRLDDARAPRVTGLKLDGKAYPVDRPVLDMDWLAGHPSLIVIGLRDDENPLDLGGLRMSVNGREVREGLGVSAEPGARGARVSLNVAGLLREQGLFLNEITLRVTDVSPQRNAASLTLRYCCLQDLKETPAVVTDSAHEGYEDLKVLTDGVIMEPGVTTYGVTWASAEKPGDHWVVLAWPEEQAWNQVEVFWTYYSGTYWGPVKLLAQTWDGSGWVTRQTLTRPEPERSTVLDLGGLKASRLRLIQPDGQGNPARPHIMWITEIKW